MEEFVNKKSNYSCNGDNVDVTKMKIILFSFFPKGKAAWETISKTVGSRVILQCSNESIGTLSQLTWKMNGNLMFAFSSGGDFYITPKATNLTLNMSKLQSELYALIIESAQIYHTGNYTCEVSSTENGVCEQSWTLIIKGVQFCLFYENTKQEFSVAT